MKAIISSYLACACVAALAAPTQAMAQQTPPAAPAAQADANEDLASTSDIIVQARRRDERLQDVPAVVNAVTAADIAKLNIRNFTEVQNLVPGLQLSTLPNGTGANAQLRGVNFDINASGNNPTVEFYLDDAPITAGVILQQVYDIGQVEVLRGPQGTLRGRASPSGSITVTTKKPDLNSIGGYVQATANDIGTQNLQGAVNVDVIPGIAAIRVAGLYNVGDANRVRSLDRSYDARDPHTRTASGRVSAIVQPVDWLRLEGMYERFDNNYRNFDQYESYSQANPAAPATTDPLITADARLSNRARPNVVSQLYDIYNGRAELSFAGQQLIYQGQHYTQKIRSAVSQDTANLFPGTDTYQNTSSNISSTSHELRLQNQERVLGIFDYVLGAFDNKNTTPTTLNSPTIVRLPLLFGGGVAALVQTPVARNGRSHEQSFFGNVTAHIGNSTQFSGGLRHISYKDVGNLVVGGNVVLNDSREEKKWIYSASVQHNFTPEIMVYASTGSSFRPGISAIGDFNIASSALERSFINLPAESSKSYEVGLKSTLFDHRAHFNISGYHQTFSNFVYRAPGNGVYYINTVAVRDAQGNVTGTSQQVANFNFVAAVPAEVNGVEGELSVDVTHRFSIGIVASYALGKIKGGTIPCTDLNKDGVPDAVTSAPTLAQLQAATGANNISACKVTQRSSFLPPFSATIQSEYSHPISDHVDAYLRGLLTFNGQSQGDPTNAFDQVGSYGLLNLFTGIRDPRGMWEINLYAKNILNTDKVLTRTTPNSTSYQQLGFGGFGPNGPILTGPTAANTTSSYTTITTTPNREFGVNMVFRFGSH
ncbi:TonB-dependent receptor [Sphingomonas oligophenolica]|uniref:TonB-dependent receptor n=1 Tax=Sphingomonas oligophenolica TaxID=301154 RepID=A0ABU9Y0D4_9SPHN